MHGHWSYARNGNMCVHLHLDCARTMTNDTIPNAGLSTSSTRTLSVSVCYGGSKSSVHGAVNSKSLTVACPARCSSAFYSVFEYTYVLFWNTFWTIAPVIGIGLFDRILGECIRPWCQAGEKLTRSWQMTMSSWRCPSCTVIARITSTLAPSCS